MTDRTVKVSLAAQVNTFISDMNRAQQATKKTGDAAQDAAAKYQEQAQAMRQIGAGLAVMGAVATAATAIAVKAAIDWETAWTGVTKTVDGTDQEMAALEENLRNLATTLPATHREIAAVAEAAGQLGVKRKDITAFTKTMIDLSETTNLTADEAATSLAQLMNVMGTAPEDVDNLGAALVALGNDGASTERDIVQMAQRIAGAGRIVGLTEGEVLGFANALASVGIEAEAGGSAVSRIMTDIAKSVSTGGEELEQFASVAGMSSKEFQKAFKDDPAEAIASFVEGLGRINAEGGDVFTTLADLGQSDIRVSQALLGMANSGDLLRKSLNLGNTALKENTALTTEAEKRYETTASKLQVLANKVNDAAIDFGDVFLPAISAVAEALGGLADAFTSAPIGVQTLAAGVVVLTAGVGLLGGAFLLAIPKIAEFRLALGVLSASQLPAVAAAAVGVQTAIGKTTAAMGAAARFLTGPWGLAIAAAAVGVGALQQVMASLQATAEEMENAAVTATSADKILTKAFQGVSSGYFKFSEDGTAALEGFQKNLLQIGDYQANILAGFTMSFESGGLRSAIKNVDEALGPLARESAPDAARAFQLLAEQTDGSEKQLLILLNEMPNYKKALTDIATENGDTATEQELLNLAMKEAAPVTKTSADAYKDAAAEASALSSEISSLIGAINEANGVGQDAISANARYQAALAGISAEVQRQKDAYEQANGSLDGFYLSLDQATASGSANAAALAEVAGAAQTAAEAQYEVDLTTMSAKDATDKYAGTLAAQRQAFEDSAVAAGYNKDEVKLLADQVFKLPAAHEIKILADTSGAVDALDRLVKTYKGTTLKLNVATDSFEIPSRATGGIIPGSPSRKDNILIHAATGEFVTNTWATGRLRPQLEYMNATGQMPPGYANGGLVQPRYASSMSNFGMGGQGATVTLNVYALPGMSEYEVARMAFDMVQRELK